MAGQVLRRAGGFSVAERSEGWVSRERVRET